MPDVSSFLSSGPWQLAPTKEGDRGSWKGITMNILKRLFGKRKIDKKEARDIVFKVAEKYKVPILIFESKEHRQNLYDSMIIGERIKAQLNNEMPHEGERL
ncbi:MAG: hypothetical protein ACE5IH_08475, partial [Thermodesulfobacteriota bacterium]